MMDRRLQTFLQRGFAGATLAVALMLAAASGASAQVLPSFGGDRAGTSGFQFLKIPVDARGAALGETAVANAFDATGLYWNPALPAQTDAFQAAVYHAAYFADVRLDYAAATVPLRAFGLTLGAHVQALGTDEMDVTTELEPFGTGETFRYGGISAGLTVSQRLTDLFSYGVTAKYVRESTAGIQARTFVFDLGVFYRVGTTGAQMAVAVRNFGLDATPSGELRRVIVGDGGATTEDEFESLTPPTTFLLGFSYMAFQANPEHNLLVAAQLNNPNDNAEQWNVGAEYTWNDLLILRAGYRFGVEEVTTPTAGLGLLVPYLGPTLRFDYGFSRMERPGTVHRLGLNLSL